MELGERLKKTSCSITKESLVDKLHLHLVSFEISWKQYVGPFNNDTFESLESSDVNADTKRRKICNEEIDQNIGNSVNNPEIIDGAGG
ncbi:hypothetical protein V6N13_043183 [Hibiscus sabdariffa]